MRRSMMVLLTVWVSATGWCDVGSFYNAGRTTLGVSGGYGSFNDNSYFVLGLGAGYYLFDGLQAGVDGEYWTASRPQFYTVSPRLTYILPVAFAWKPYIGGFYKRTFYSSVFDNINSAGGRAGVFSELTEHTALNAGLVYEKILDCDSTVYSHCSQVYPELGLTFSY